MSRPFFIDEGDVQILDSPEEVLTTLTREGKRRWLYPTLSKGRYHRARLMVAWVLLVFFVGLPWLKIGGKPAVLLDFVHREFVFFGVTFYPTDTFLLLLLALAVGISILLFTALWGRVWCGWACPQTVYLEFVYRPIERWIEGPEHKRKRRDEGPWTWDKVWRKAAKLSLYLVLSFFIAHTFVAYFVGWDALIGWMSGPPTAHWGFFLTAVLTTGLMLFNFGYFREQMCTIACPYARIQSVLLDPDSLIVSYDPNRGEPRAKRSKKKMEEEAAGLRPALGDCIDCFACVRTCPTGIDIRDGLQMECIACTQCIDACDSIMDNLGKPRGLIRYTSEHELDDLKTRRLRPRTVVYTALLALLLTAFTIAVTTRDAYDVNVGRAIGEPFTELPDGTIANRLRFRVRNQTGHTAAFTVEAVEPAGAQLRIVGASPITLEPEEMKRTEVWVVVPAATFADAQTRDGVFVLRFDDGTEKRLRFPLLGPSP